MTAGRDPASGLASAPPDSQYACPASRRLIGACRFRLGKAAAAERPVPHGAVRVSPQEPARLLPVPLRDGSEARGQTLGVSHVGMVHADIEAQRPGVTLSDDAGSDDHDA